MDMRNLDLWATEAKLKGLVRKAEAANAALLPRQETKTVNRYLDSLRFEMMELEHEGEADKVDQENERRIAEAQVKMDARRADIRARRAAGETIVRRRPKRSAKAKVIR